MRTLLILSAFSAITFAACNGSDSTNTTNTTTTTAPVATAPAHSKLSAGNTALLMDVLGRYYAVKNALVATKSADAAGSATRLASGADSLLAEIQKDSANAGSLKPYLDTIVMQSKVIASLTDESCEKQRVAFEYVSRSFYGLLRGADVKNAHAYHQYCPMAFNDKGAYWLSEESDIKNPYFGKKMLECGETTDSL